MKQHLQLQQLWGHSEKLDVAESGVDTWIEKLFGTKKMAFVFAKSKRG
jgi:hypothetical protein